MRQWTGSSLLILNLSKSLFIPCALTHKVFLLLSNCSKSLSYTMCVDAQGFSLVLPTFLSVCNIPCKSTHEIFPPHFEHFWVAFIYPVCWRTWFSSLIYKLYKSFYVLYTSTDMIFSANFQSLLLTLCNIHVVIGVLWPRYFNLFFIFSGSALYIMFENHVRSWPLLKKSLVYERLYV